MNKYLLIALFLIVTVAIGAFIGFTQVKRTPTNALKVIRNTISERNVEEFHRLVDVDKILDNAQKSRNRRENFLC